MTTPRPRSMPPLRVAALALLGLLAGAASASAQAPISPGGLAAGTPALAAVPALVGQPLSFAGTVGGTGAGSRLQVQLRARATTQWRTVATVVADGDGAFQASWTSVVAGRFAVRAVPLGRAVAASVEAPLATTVTVYRPATATWYDLAGRTGACGVHITAATIGVAHKTLPCGSRVDVRYGDRTLSVPVIDRGPYARGVSYDLTRAAADALGMTAAGKAQVGVLPAGERTPSALLLAGAFGGLPAVG